MAIHPDGTHRHRIGSGIGEYPRYSPDGTKILYGSGADGQIHVMRADGSNDHALTSAGGDYPDWSPNGRLIGYTSGGQVWIMRADGSHKHQVTTTGASYSPVFSPDGAWIAYSTGSGAQISVSRIDGTHAHDGGHPRASAASGGSPGRNCNAGGPGRHWGVPTMRRYQ